ncbi:acetyltransferase (GNAT) family protein [Frankia sp. EI5c]|uniref:GNAT family N-acetyltransferase n=1 Tax=Frankia sp. EI5c TaxID=683316 RepID=UPI0007C3C310|nr:GNAT family N-acetyltransferase [Frankia sp. EI5c]OAA27508.1 acetyltransferase (GNAT) family protein [Frankia sp. EI5c]
MDWKIGRLDPTAADLDEVLAVYELSGLGQRRPVEDRELFEAMVRNANLVVGAWLGGVLVGFARALSDFSYVTYLADIAVVREHQNAGIGRAMIEAVRREAPRAKIVLLAAPAARGYYPRLGFTQHDSAWVLNSQP